MAYWTDKVALVTGGSSGLGLAIALALNRAGARLAIAGRDTDRLQAAALQLTAGPPCLTIPADVTRQVDVERLIQQVVAQQGRLDVLVNCAGRSSRGAIAETTAEQFQELLDINFLSAVRCTQAALPHLLTSRGHVVQIGSLASKSASRHLGAYPASKFPLAAYAQQLRLELADQGLHVLLVCPGPIRRGDAGERYAKEAANLPPEARRPGGGVKLKGIDPDWLARRILRSCERRQAELIVPGRARLLFAIAQLWPRLGDWVLTRMTASSNR
jgi:NAD(P)-dependent dehydrogenase (short-subunit alcohol dehydrogenase family)